MNNLETFGPKLTKVSKENPYKVPEGYFDSLPSRVQDYCKEQESRKQPISLVFTLKTQLAFAAGICFFLLLSIGGFYYSKHTSDLSLFHKTDYIKIVVESGTEFDEIQLYEAYSNSTKKDTLKKPMNDELMEYLLNENVDNGTLLGHSRDIRP
jgi:hypothetical protein